PVRDVATAGYEAVVALVQLAHVDDLDRVRGEEAVELVYVDGLHRLGLGAVERVAAKLYEPDRAEASGGVFGLLPRPGEDQGKLVREKHERRPGREAFATERDIDQIGRAHV